MSRRALFAALIVISTVGAGFNFTAGRAEASNPGQPTDWNRYRYYPYVYYPHNFQKPRVNNHLYYKYPQRMQIPVYNKNWHNFYPTERPYHSGHHFILDVF